MHRKRRWHFSEALRWPMTPGMGASAIGADADWATPGAAGVAGSALEVALVASTPALVCVIGAGGRILLFNPALEVATGWSSREVLGRAFWDVLAVPHEVALAEDCISRALATGVAPPQEGDWLDRWGGYRRVAMQNSVLVDAEGRPYAMVCVGVDVTQQRRVEAQLRLRAETDVLTGLLNRVALLRAMQEELTDPTSPGCGILFCDLDNFKRANDTHGHAIGDLLLREVAGRLVEVAAATDLVARFGGDEFVVLSRRTDAGRLATLRRDVEAAITQPFETPQGLVDVGVSVGAAFGHFGDDSDRLLSAADRHMYGVKTGRRQ